MPKSHIDPAEPNSAVYRKISWRLLPLLFVLYAAAYLDRVNVGFARLQMNADLGFSDTVYGAGAGIFFLGYFLFEIPSNLILYRVGARVWIARILVGWGLISAAMAWVHSAQAFYSLRFLLGIAEAGFFPGILCYMTAWYPAEHRARSTAWFMAAIPACGVVGGPLSGWIMSSLDGFHDLRGWQWLFIIEGLPAVGLGMFTMVWLPDHPNDVAWLDADEKVYLQTGIASEQGLPQPLSRSQNVGDTVCSARVWRLAALYFLLVVGHYGISFWLPQLVHGFKPGTFTATGLLSALPYAAAGIGMVMIGGYSDRTGKRRIHLIACCLLGTAGFIATRYFNTSLIGSLAGLSVAAIGTVSALTVFWTLPTAFLSGRAAAVGIALINSIGNIGGYFSPLAVGWLQDATGRMDHGLVLLAAALGFAVLLLLPRSVFPDPDPPPRDGTA